jgi:hypothetical protein
MNMARSLPVARTKPCLKPSESRSWFAEREELTPDVERIFVEESRKHNAPSKDACRTVASALMVVRAPGNRRAPRHPNPVDSTRAQICYGAPPSPPAA